MANGNGTSALNGKSAAAWVAIGVALLTSLASFARDVPSRAEMEKKDAVINERVDRQYMEMVRRLERIEAILLEQGNAR